jgi:hypothetical protein
MQRRGGGGGGSDLMIRSFLLITIGRSRPRHNIPTTVSRFLCSDFLIFCIAVNVVGLMCESSGELSPQPPVKGIL